MAIFGTIDGKAFANNVGVTQTDATVTKNAADTVEEGDVLEIDGVNYIVRTVTSTTAIELHKAYAGSTNNNLAKEKVIRRTPPKAVAEYVIKEFIISLLKKAAAKTGNKVDDQLVAQLEKALLES